MLNIIDASTLNMEAFNLLNMKTLQERLKWALTQSGIKKIDLAKEVGVTRAAVTAWFNGSTQTIEGANLTNAAKALKVNSHWLATGKGDRLRDDLTTKRHIETNVSPSLLGGTIIPRFAKVPAGNWRQIVDDYAPGASDDYLIYGGSASRHMFALIVMGNSMEPEFKDGDSLVVDPEISPNAGDYVIARNHKFESTFKKYRPRGLNEKGQEYFELVPLNPDYETMRSDLSEIEIIGVVVEHRRGFRR